MGEPAKILQFRPREPAKDVPEKEPVRRVFRPLEEYAAAWQQWKDKGVQMPAEIAACAADAAYYKEIVDRWFAETGYPADAEWYHLLMPIMGYSILAMNQEGVDGATIAAVIARIEKLAEGVSIEDAAQYYVHCPI